MATLSGCAGSVTLGEGPDINIYEWSADVRRDVFDDSDFGSATNARSKVGGMADLAGTCRGRCKTDTQPGIGSMATEHKAATAGFYLEADGANNKNYKFSGLLSNVTVNVTKTGIIDVSASFESSGAVSVDQT